jgi:hypothetical protein
MLRVMEKVEVWLSIGRRGLLLIFYPLVIGTLMSMLVEAGILVDGGRLSFLVSLSLRIIILCGQNFER